MADNKITGDFERFSYSLGMSIAGNLIKSGVKSIHPDYFIEGLKDAFGGEMPKILPDEANKILEDFISKANEGAGKENLESGLAFLTENSKKEGVIELPSGLQYKVLEEGEGDIPSINHQVKCHYHGTLIDGRVFDSSVERNEPAVFPVNGVIKGWTEALQLMSVGSKWRLFIPSDLAYGEQGAGGVIGPNSTLIFEVELLEIV